VCQEDENKEESSLIGRRFERSDYDPIRDIVEIIILMVVFTGN
jgi:hypothetical protein